MADTALAAAAALAAADSAAAVDVFGDGSDAVLDVDAVTTRGGHPHHQFKCR